MGLLDKNRDIDDVDTSIDFNNTVGERDGAIESDLSDFSFEDKKASDETSNDDDIIKESLSNNEDSYINDAISNNVEIESSDNIADRATDSKKPKLKLFGKNNKNNNTVEDVKEQVPAKDLVLYMIMDKINMTTLEYFRAYGIKVSKIFTNIKEAQDVILMQIDPFKLVVVDTGTGRFSSMGARKELVDAISLCEDSIDIFYTDTAIKSELNSYEAIAKKNITWENYKSTAAILARLLSLHTSENYIYDEYDTDDITDNSEDILNFSGLASKAKLDRNVVEPLIDIEDIKHHIENGEDADMLDGYVIKI